MIYEVIFPMRSSALFLYNDGLEEMRKILDFARGYEMEGVTTCILF